MGSHFCLGANLARMELRVALTELLRRLPDMRFATDGPVIRPHFAGPRVYRDEDRLHPGIPGSIKPQAAQ